MKRIMLFLIVASTFIGACQDEKGKKNTTRGLTPEAAMETFELPEGFQIEQIAAEPLVADPVAMEIDEYGRLYVVEMHGYPLDKNGSGVVKLLEDTDGDGKMDKSTVFADDLILPTGVMRWKKGILVTDPPNVLYLEDTDGDGKADKRETVLSGFALANPQHNVNNPIWGIDNWIYLGHEPAATAQVYTDYFSDRGSDVHYPNLPNSPRLPDNALGRSVRFQPDKGLLENLSSQTQFGHTFNQWGDRFLASNAHHIYHEVLAARYLGRNPHFLITNTIESVSDHGNAADVYPITKNPQHQLLTDLGVFTSACGITSYTGGLFPAPFQDVTLVAEPVSNLVHADVLQPNGATFKASRLYEKKEFLASTDPWFRPVNMYVGPDGALYVLDYYRQIIEHPEWMADDVGKSDAVYNGIDQGRIYRITPKGTGKADWTKGLQLGEATDEQLVQYLSHANSWWRKNAQRMLVDRQTKAAVPALEAMVQNSSEPLGRLHALWTLHGLGALTAPIVTIGLHDKEAGVRENALRMAEDLFLKQPHADSDFIVQELLKRKNEPSDKVRFQLMATLGFSQQPAVQELRKQLLFQNLDNQWMQIAALSALPADNASLLEEAIKRYGSNKSDQLNSLTERLATIVTASSDVTVVKDYLNKALATQNKGKEWRFPLLRGINQTIRRSGIDASALTNERELLLATYQNSTEMPLRQAALEVLRVAGLPDSETTQLALKKAEELIKQRDANPEARISAIQLLTLTDVKQHLDLFKQLIVPAEPISVQRAALHAINTLPDVTVSKFLVEKWSTLTPGLREQAIGTFLGNGERIAILLDALEQKIIDPTVISWPRQVGLMANGNEALRVRARRLLSAENSSEKEAIQAFQEALTLPADVARGKEVFTTQCAICHQIGGKQGVFYGPDLATIRNRRPESVMADILNPNLSIADGYDIWNIELHNGETVQGLIASETPSALTVRNYGGVETVISRPDIKGLTAMGTSAMTAGFDKILSTQQMADLLHYLKQPQ